MSHPSQATTSSANGVTDLAAECKKRENLCSELLAERDQLRGELAQTKSERDQYLKSLYYYLRKEAPVPTFTKEELFAHLDDKPSILDVLGEMEQGLEKP